MKIRWKVSIFELLSVSCVCILGTVILIFYTTTSIDTVRINPCKTNDSNHNHLERSRQGKCIREWVPSMLTANYDSYGRLGNQMLQYATMFAVGRYNNRTAFMSHRMSDVISKYFEVTLDTLDQKVYDNTSWTGKTVGGVVDSSIRNLTQPFVRLNGVPHAWKYFDEIRGDIRNQFQFHDEIVQKSKIKLRSIRGEFYPYYQIGVTMIGIHVRRGDYITNAQVRGFHLPGMEFYIGAMLYFEERYLNVIFVIASDDIPWCTKNFSKLKGRFRIHVLQSNDSDYMVGLDMATLTHCHHLIYGLGSFGFWAGYLNSGEVIFCSDCMTSTTLWMRLKEVYNGDYGNVVLPSWIGYSRNGTRTDRSVLARTEV